MMLQLIFLLTIFIIANGFCATLSIVFRFPYFGYFGLVYEFSRCNGRLISQIPQFLAQEQFKWPETRPWWELGTSLSGDTRCKKLYLTSV